MSVCTILGLVVWCLATLAAGMICLGRPTAVRDYALRTTPKWNRFRGGWRPTRYIWSIRLTGVIAPGLFLLVLYISIWGK